MCRRRRRGARAARHAAQAGASSPLCAIASGNRNNGAAGAQTQTHTHTQVKKTNTGVAAVQELTGATLSGGDARLSRDLLEACSKVAADVQSRGGALAKVAGGVPGMDYALLAAADILRQQR